MLLENNFFHKNTNKLFSFLNSNHEDLFNEDSRDNKKRLEIGTNMSDNILNLEDITALDLENSLTNNDIVDNSDNSQLIYEDNTDNKNKNTKHTNSTNSEISSRSSNTLNSDGKNNCSEYSSSTNSDDSFDCRKYNSCYK